MGVASPTADDNRKAFLALYDVALPQVYAYLSVRCPGRAIAEDLTAETFLAAVDAVRSDDPPRLTVAWLIGVARHKLLDHWRRQAREERRLEALAETTPVTTEPWEERLDALAVARCLEGMATQHRAALTLRYLDDLPVAEVAELLGRTVHATEALLVRSRAAFRRAYLASGAEHIDDRPGDEGSADG